MIMISMRERNLVREISGKVAVLVAICVLAGVTGSSARAQEANDLLFDALTARREGRYDEGISLLDLAAKKARGQFNHLLRAGNNLRVEAGV